MSEEWVCQNCGYVGNKKEFLENGCPECHI